jgi:hypothetical protein
MTKSTTFQWLYGAVWALADSRWDALGPSEEKVKDEDDTSGVKLENGDKDENDEGRIWRVQAHARSSITSMKVDPVNGSGVSSGCAVYCLEDQPAALLTMLAFHILL